MNCYCQILLFLDNMVFANQNEKLTGADNNLVPRAFARFRGSGMGRKGPGKHWLRDSKNIGHFCKLTLLRSCHPGGGEQLNIAMGEF